MARTFLAVLAASLAVVTPAAAAPDASTGTPPGVARVLVGFAGAPGLEERALVAGFGAKVRHVLPEARALALELPADRVDALARAGGVSYVEPDAKRYALGLGDAELEPALTNGLYGLLTTNATAVHARAVTGAGIRACVADTGLAYTHPDIAPRYKGGIDTVDDDADPWWNGDLNETHGTHVAGTVVAALGNGQGVRGVAYGADLYHARVLGPDGGYSSDIMAGVRWLVEQAGCKVVNMSLGGGSFSFSESRFYSEMDSKGALIVAAAGNDGNGSLSYPARYGSNVSVAALDVSNARAAFSNYGSGLDLSAPGVDVLSSVPGGTGFESSVAAGGQGYRAFGLQLAGATPAGGVGGLLVDCALGKPGECPASVAGNVALIRRGEISFASKVTTAMNAGAVAAVIFNNVPGDFTGTLETAGSWIPAVTVSDAAGAALALRLGEAATVVNFPTAWDHYSGTSMAAPHVAGVAALVWSAKPSLTDEQVEETLKSTATDLGAAGADTGFGYGLVNADRAVGAVLPAPDTTPPAIASLSPADGATGVAAGANVTVAFDEAMDAASTQGAFSLVRTADGAPVAGSFAWSGNTMTFDPSADLASATQYTATVTTGARDQAGNALAAARAWSFTTAATPVSSTLSPFATVIEAGTLRGGSAASLASDDGAFYQVGSSGLLSKSTAWYGRFAGVPNSISSLRVTYSGSNSAACSQVVAIYRWSDLRWVTLDSRSVGSTEILLANLAPTGVLADYVSGATGDGEVRVRVRCTGSTSWITAADLLGLTFAP